MKKIIIAVILIVIIGGGLLLYKDKDNKLEETKLKEEMLKEEIGQMIVVGFKGTEVTKDSDIYKIIKDVKIGGVSLANLNYPSKSFPRNIVNPRQTKKLIFDLQANSEIPLFVAVDAEGGAVNRLVPRLGFLPILSPKEMGDDKTLITTEKESIKLAKELKGLGFNMNLAPVLDLNLDSNNLAISFWNRSFSSSSEEVVRHARVFIENHLKNNIITVGKHFPGLGSVTGDIHNFVPDVTNSYKEEELFPFKKLNEEGMLNVVMLGHVISKKIDDQYPVTFSSKFLQGILRKQIGFKGIIMTDDVQMYGISQNYKFDEAVVMAINAGCDIIYAYNNRNSDYDRDISYKIRDAIFNAVKNNKIAEKRITESYNRILSLKKQFRIIPPTAGKAKAEKIR